MAGSNPQLVVKIIANTAELIKNLEAGRGAIEQYGPSIAKMQDTWKRHGAEMVQQAALVAAGLKDVNLATLTAADSAKALKQLENGMKQLAAEGRPVPAMMQQTADKLNALHPAAGAATSALNLLKGAAGALGLAFSVGAVVNFGRKVFDAASEIKDMGAKLGISTDAVQGFKFAAEQTGSSLDSVGTAINKMNMNLAGGDKATVQALKDAGLEFNTIRGMKPEDAFLAISDAIQKIPDPMTQSDVAMQLFGKGAADLLPGMKEGFRGLADSAGKMSKDTIASLEAAQDAWEALANKVTIASGTIIAHAMRSAEGVTGTWRKFGQFVENALTLPGGAGMAVAMANMEQAAADATEEVKKIEPAVKAATVAHVQHAAAVKETKAQVDLFHLSVDNNLIPVVKRLGTEIAIGSTQMSGFAYQLQVTQSMIPAGPRGIFGGDLIGIPELAKETQKVTVDLTALAQSFANLSQIAGGSFGAIAGGLATLIGSLSAARQSVDTLKAGMAAMKSGETMAGIAGMATGIMGIVSAAMAAVNGIKAIWSALDRNKGRDVVVDYAESMGGFDELHKQLLALGDAGEALWVKLTQGVGRNNPEQAAKVVAEVEAALAKQAAAAAAASVETEAGAQATIETATQAALALDELNGRLATNAEAWGAWSEDVTGFLQKLANDIRSMPLPSASGPVYDGGGPSGGIGPGPSSSGGSSSSGPIIVGGGDTHITLTMPDGDVLLKQVVKSASRGGM